MRRRTVCGVRLKLLNGAGQDDTQDSLTGGSGADVLFGHLIYDVFYSPTGNAGDLVDDLLVN